MRERPSNMIMQFTCRGNAETLYLIQFKYDIICKNTAKINLMLKLQTHPCKLYQYMMKKMKKSIIIDFLIVFIIC